MKAAAEKAGWQKRPSPAPASSGNIAKGRGIALTKRANTYVAVVAEVEVNKTTGQVAVKRIVCSHDCGLMVNPDGVKNQVEGNVIQGVSRAMYEEVDIRSQRRRHQPRLGKLIRSCDFRTCRSSKSCLINRPEMQPLGAGEGATIPPAAAIANAIFDAVGVAAPRRTVYTEAGFGGDAEEGVIVIRDHARLKSHAAQSSRSAN